MEDVVDFFQATEGCFWVEEVDEWEDDDVARSYVSRCQAVLRDRGYSRAGEDDIKLPLDRPETRRGNDNANEVGSPIRRSRQGIRRASNPQWNNLDLVEPGHALPANGVEGAENEDECGSGIQRLPCVDLQHDGEDDHAEGHTG